MDKFDWLASESAPENYPMQIIQGDFIFKEGGSLYIPSGGTLDDGWGRSVSTHVVGAKLKPLPHQLTISFFSYTEDQFYQGDFSLPYERILELFQQGYHSTKEGGHTTYDAIVAGIAPGGVVSVWLEGLNKNTQVFYGKAEKADIPWASINDNPKYPRKTYVSLVLEETLSPKALKNLKTNGVPLDLWDRYQTQYHWQPNFITEGRPPKIIEKILYVNGEEDYLFYPLTPPISDATRAIPDMLYYIWKSPTGEGLEHHLDFDVAEITAAFEKLQALKPATVDSPFLLTMKLTEHEDGRKIAIAVQHGEDGFMLNNTGLKQYISNIPFDDPDAFHQD